jgi:hypothetical protein
MRVPKNEEAACRRRVKYMISKNVFYCPVPANQLGAGFSINSELKSSRTIPPATSHQPPAHPPATSHQPPVCVCVCMYVRMYVCVYVRVCVCVCMYVCMYVFMYVCVYVCVYVCMYVCTYVCMYVCVYFGSCAKAL